MKKIILSLISIVSLVSITHSQTLRQYKKEAEKAFLAKDYYAALAHYEVVLNVDSSNMNYVYNHAESARNFHAYERAEKSYERVSKSTQKKDFPETNFWLASIKKNLLKYDDAKRLYQEYMKTVATDSPNYIEAQKEIEYLNWAATVIEQPLEEVAVQRLGTEVNTGYNEFSPMPVGDSLYFASLRFEKKKDTQFPIRMVAKTLLSADNGMGEALPDSFNAADVHTSNMSINSDKTRLYYTICDYAEDGMIPCEIYYRNINPDGSWGAGIKLPDSINMPNTTTTQPNISVHPQSGKPTLYFVSNRAGGKGEKDIWYSEIDAAGNFGEPVNLMSVNTEKDDVTPFYHGASQTLYFSSMGYQNLGGFDVFKTENVNGNWQDITHLGAPINSSYNDFYYVIKPDESEAYFASNRLGSANIDEDKEACCNDIYKVEFAPINILALTFHEMTKEALNGVTVQLIEREVVLEEDKHEEDNTYEFGVKRGKEYVLIGSRPNYSSDTITVSTMDLDNLEGKLYLRPLMLDLTALTFDFNSKFDVDGATVKLYACDGTYVTELTHLNKNDFLFDMVRPENCYQLITSHPDYYSDTTSVTIGELLEPIHLKEKIFLKIKPVTKETLDKYLPMPLYFDNDYPDPNTTRDFTIKTYPQTIDAYLARRDEFKSEYGDGLRGEKRIVSDDEIDAFFDTYVQVGIDTLQNFDDYLIRYIEQGNTAELMIRGFASPLASTRYNENLTKRRISSILNHFKTCHQGKLESLIQEGRLKITQAPHGELLAEEGVSDDPSDRKNSIYSPAASKERRVEIIEIKVKGTEQLGSQH